MISQRREFFLYFIVVGQKTRRWRYACGYFRICFNRKRRTFFILHLAMRLWISDENFFLLPCTHSREQKNIWPNKTFVSRVSGKICVAAIERENWWFFDFYRSLMRAQKYINKPSPKYRENYRVNKKNPLIRNSKGN